MHYRYQSVKLHAAGTKDLRPDAIAVSKLLHPDDLQISVEYSKGFRVRFWDLFNITTPPYYTRTLVTSAEMIVQLATPLNLNVTMSDKDTFDRLVYYSGRIHSVGTNRYETLKGDHVHQDAVLICYGLFQKYKQKRAQFPFPNNQSPFPGPVYVMCFLVTVIWKSLCLKCRPLNPMLRSRNGVVVIALVLFQILAAVLLWLYQPVFISQGVSTPIRTLIAETRWRLELVQDFFANLPDPIELCLGRLRNS
jgi:hypothetical protein